MLNKVSKFLLCTVFAVLNVSAANASDCGCPQAVQGQRYVVEQGNQPEVIYPSVRNYDCSGQMQAPAPVYVEREIPAPQPAPVVRQRPAKVYHVVGVDEPKERRLAPLHRDEVVRRGRVEKVQEYTYRPSETKSESEFVMSSRSERKKIFEGEGEDKPCRDGSIFGGGPCKSKDKNGSIFGGGPCKTCSKNGSIFGGGSCKNCSKNGSIFGGGTCKNCSKNGSIFGGGSCKNCKTLCDKPSCSKPACSKAPCQKAPCQAPKPCPYATPAPCPCAAPAPAPVVAPVPCPCAKTAPQPAPKPTCVKKYEMQEVVRSCKDFAPFSMDWVDFRITRNGSQTYSRNLGNYRFRIFGCRRNTKNAILNEGRITEKDMNFGEIFSDMVSDCYTVVKTDQCIDENTPLPEYVLTAEITNYFMNVCDEYNWDEAQMENSRHGSSEMTVVWRLMDASKTNVLWKGESKGYGEVAEGEYNGEMLLLQRAFAEAADNLRYLPGFEDQLAVRVSAEEMQRQRQMLMDIQRASGICQFKIVEDSGIVSTGYGVEEKWVEIKEIEVPVVTPEPIVVTKHTPVVVEDSGIVDTTIVAAEKPIVVMQNPAVVEASGVAEDGVVAKEPVAAGAIYEADKLCIVERADYANMGPDNVTETRKSIVTVINTKGKSGSGLLISEQFVMTSADLVNREENRYTVKTVKGETLEARAFRLNPRRNTALLILSQPAEYAPLALTLDLPPVNKGSYVAPTMGDDDAALVNTSKVTSYRYTPDGTAEIVVENFIPKAAIGSSLLDEKGRVAGMSHRVQDPSVDVFLPMETVMRSLGVEICGKAFPKVAPKPQEKVWRKPVAAFVDNPEAKAPEAMPVKNRK